jgi:hypothetical protein
MEYKDPRTFIITHADWKGSAFGDNIMSIMLAAVLKDNGYHAVLKNKQVSRLADPNEVEIFDLTKKYQKVHNFVANRGFQGKKTEPRLNIYTDLIRVFKNKFNIEEEIPLTRNVVPVKYYDMDVEGVDVCMTTEVLHKKVSFKQWHYFDRLKQLFDKHGITYFDFNKEGTRGIKLLNYVVKSKLYLGMETGTPHYTSKHGAGKTLIIQSGFCDWWYWADTYDYEYISYPVDCAACYKEAFRGQKCPHKHKCMSNITPEMVFDRVMEKLNDS